MVLLRLSVSGDNQPTKKPPSFLVDFQSVTSVDGSKMKREFVSKYSEAGMHPGQVQLWYGGHNLRKNCIVLLKMHAMKGKLFGVAGFDGQQKTYFPRCILTVLLLNFSFLPAGSGDFLDDGVLQHNLLPTKLPKYLKTTLLQSSIGCASIGGIHGLEIPIPYMI
ncbi:hypothetical protein BDD12DRAFT_455577 [Trichophaea hybrida]|nr:hypothetical protein BDD12DRAFT_455577 [Trichophaea hybrida]